MQRIVLVIGVVFGLTACTAQDKSANKESTTAHMDNEIKDARHIDTATFGSGCFWCTEAVFQELKGVEKAISGYSGGKIKNPTYREVSSGLTGHAEVIQVYYDTSIISFDELLEVFWLSHDPTTLNRQGADVGTQYRSAIFYHTEEQKEKASAYKKKLNEEQAFNAPVVTEITAFDAFYPAESDHQEFYANNPDYGYCRVVIQPKLDKVRKVFKDKIKE